MYRNTFHHRVVSGAFTLPAAILITFVLWLISGLGNWQLWAGLGITGLTAYLIRELNNRNALLRIRSHLMCSTFLIITAICPMLHAFSGYQGTVLCFVLSLTCLFASYQKLRPQGYIFHTFLFIGIASLFFKPILVLAIALYFSMLFQLRNMQWNTFMAGLLGLLTPYWLTGVYAIWQEETNKWLMQLSWFDCIPGKGYDSIDTQQWTSAGIIAFFAILSLIHFFRNSYNDKIRTRMLIYTIATQEVVLLVCLIAFPQHFNGFFSLFAANSSLLIAHYFALAKGRFFHWWFNISISILLVLGLINACS